jgi:RNA polymerase sigma-70 factor (ECF subfamily)
VMNAGSDLELVRLIRKGDERAARELWARVGPSLLAVARAVARDKQLAEDSVQQAMCRLLELKERQVKEIRDVGAFLACMVRRLALNQARTESRLKRRDRGAIAGPERTPSEHLARALQDDRLEGAIAALPDELGEVVLLRHVGGLTFDQLALALNENRSTIAGRYRRAIEELSLAMGATDEHSGNRTTMGATR